MASSIGQFRYSLSEIEEIAGGEKPRELPETARDLINELAALVGAPTYVRTPVFHTGNKSGGNKSGGSSRRRGNRSMEVHDEDWETLRTFETTKSVTKEGPEVLLDQIRKSFNKISEGNYTSQMNEIMQNIERAETEYEGALTNDIVKLIMKMATGSIFFAKLYAKIIVDLSQNFESMFEKEIASLLSNYVESLSEIITCKPEEDYDRFCKMNVDNERRRATGVLIMRLGAFLIIDIPAIHDVINTLISEIKSNVDTEGMSYKTEEIAEMLLAMIQSGTDELELFEDEWDTLVENINSICDLKVREHEGLSNKCLFKCMDIRDLL